MTDKYNRFCGNCRFSSFFYKDKPCINCRLIPSQFLTKEEITDENIPMGRRDRRELITYRKIKRAIKDVIETFRKEV